MIGATLQNKVWPSVTAWLASPLMFDEPPLSAKVLLSTPVMVLVVATPAATLEF
jgi:hypothetical protein